MADTYTKHEILVGNSRTYTVVVTGVIDTGGSSTIAVDKSELTIESHDTHDLGIIAIESVEWSVGGLPYVTVEWDHTADVVGLALSGAGEMCFTGKLGSSLKASDDGGTGDLLIKAPTGQTGAFTVAVKVSY